MNVCNLNLCKIICSEQDYSEEQKKIILENTNNIIQSEYSNKIYLLKFVISNIIAYSFLKDMFFERKEDISIYCIEVELMQDHERYTIYFNINEEVQYLNMNNNEILQKGKDIINKINKLSNFSVRKISLIFGNNEKIISTNLTVADNFSLDTEYTKYLDKFGKSF